MAIYNLGEKTGVSASGSSSGGGILPQSVSTLPATLTRGVSYQVAQTATTDGQLPVTTQSATIEVTDATGQCSSTKQIGITPGAGDSIRYKGTLITGANRFVMRRPYVTARFNKAAGSNVWEVTYQTIAISPPASNSQAGTVSFEGSGSFTVYLKNPAGADFVSGTANWVRTGRVVVVRLPTLETPAAVTNTGFTFSTSNQAGVNTWPAEITPSSQQTIILASREGAVSTFQASLATLSGSGLFTLYRDLAASSFSGTSAIKGTGTALTFTYMV